MVCVAPRRSASVFVSGVIGSRKSKNILPWWQDGPLGLRPCQHRRRFQEPGCELLSNPAGCPTAARHIFVELADHCVCHGGETLRSRTLSAAIFSESDSENWAIREAALVGRICMRTTAAFCTPLKVGTAGSRCSARSTTRKAVAVGGAGDGRPVGRDGGPRPAKPARASINFMDFLFCPQW